MLLDQIPSYFKARRKKLTDTHKGAAFLFPSSPQVLRNPDVHFPFRQESNFYYLTGFEEPESILLMVPSENGKEYQTILFVLPRDPEKEMWEGERYGIEGAKNVFGADEAYSIREFDIHFPRLIHHADRIFYRIGVHADFDRKVVSGLEKVRRSSGRSGRCLLPIEDPVFTLGEMRLFKSEEEAQLLRQACRVSAEAHRKVMSETRPGMNEGEIEALIDFYFRKNGCQRLGYGSIVASGKNAACLHYRSNNEPLKDGELLLIDAGGEHNYYTADITRTFPTGKQFTRAQAQVYDVVLRAQKEAVSMVRPGRKLTEIHQRTCEVLVEGLTSLGLLKGKPSELLAKGEHRKYYPHQTSHWLGMDVHDVGLYLLNGEPRPLEPGMVFTIEPGFYVQPTDKDTPAEFQNIGIRIEDDILVTSKGYENLTEKAPKDREELESLKK